MKTLIVLLTLFFAMPVNAETRWGIDVANLSGFGANATAISGNVMAVGAPYVDGEGVVYVYRKVGPSWKCIQYIYSPQPQEWQDFGFSVEASDNGNTIAIGACSKNYGNCLVAGVVFIFEYEENTETWYHTSTLMPIACGGFFGDRVRILDDFVVVSAPYEDAGGAIYVYPRHQNWPSDILRGEGGFAGDYYGYRIYSFDNTLLVERRGNDGVDVHDLVAGTTETIYPYDWSPGDYLADAYWTVNW